MAATDSHPSSNAIGKNVSLPPFDYAELHCRSNFSFLEGASHPEEMVEQAAALGYSALALTDRDGLYGAVRLDVTARKANIRTIFGAEVTLEADPLGGGIPSEKGGPVSTHLVLLAQNVAGYKNLSSLLTLGRRARPKGEAAVNRRQVAEYADGLFVLTGALSGGVSRALLRGDRTGAEAEIAWLRESFGVERVFLEVTNHLLPVEAQLRPEWVSLARKLDLPLVATQDARYATPDRRRLLDVLTCIRHHTTLEQAGTRLLPNAEFGLQPREVLARRFQSLPEALRNTLLIASQCQVLLSDLKFQLPEFPIPAPYRTALDYLEHLTFLNAPARFPEVNARAVGQLRHELEVIGRHRLEGYFLIVWDIVKFCHDRGILIQGRGSAANSAVCFSLGITNVDPIRLELLFERFLSEGRDQAPDIDLDIANDRREEVIQYVYERYGRDHAGMVCEVICYRARSAVRDVGKALGLSLEQVDRIAKGLDGWDFKKGWVGEELGASSSQRIGGSSEEIVEKKETVKAASEYPEDPVEAERGFERGPFEGLTEGSEDRERGSTHDQKYEQAPVGADTAVKLELPLSEDEQKIAGQLWELCQQIEGFPRHLGIHVGGMIVCGQTLGAMVPIENATMDGRTVIQWDKDDIEALRMPKIDLLGLGILALIHDAVALVKIHEGVLLDLARLTYDDPAVYDMLCESDTVGVFQVESRAQMSVLPRLKPRCFYDLVVQVSLIRPGPIQGEMVHPYMRRRDGREPVTYPHPDLEPILKRTLGVPLFQEQGMKVAIIAAGFSPSEANALRKAMSSKRSHKDMEALTVKLVEGMSKNGYGLDIAQRIVNQIKAFANYGFPESHAASFALLVYVSGYLKCYHARAFYAALLNNQPMGFYSPATIVSEMRRRNIPVYAVDVTYSRWEWTLEQKGLRAGLMSLKGAGESHRQSWEKALEAGPWRSIDDVCLRSGWPKALLERLAAAGAFRSLKVERREALWQVQGFRPRPGLAAPGVREMIPALRSMVAPEALAIDMKTVGHSTGGHPIQFLRPTLTRWKVVPGNRLQRVRGGETVRVAGVVSVRQKPPTAKGFCFITLEDETAMINVIVRPDIYEHYRSVVRRSILLLVEGSLQRQTGVLNVLAEKIATLDDKWAAGMKSRDFH